MSRRITDEQMRRILEDSDGEDDFIEEMDLASQDFLEQDDFLESGTYDANNTILPMEEDVITIQKFIDDTNPGDVNAYAFEPATNPVLPDVNPFVPDDDNPTVPATNIVALSEDLVSPTDNPVAPADNPVQISTTWQNNIRELPREVFTGYDTGKRHEQLFLENSDLWTIFCEIVDNEVIQLMVIETNRYAIQANNDRLNPSSRLKRWKPVTAEEMRKFLGVYLLTGVLNFPTIETYWKKDRLYYHPLLHEINMSYNRFSLILKCWHFTNNAEVRESRDRLYKIQPLVDKIIHNCRKIYTPGERVVVDESMVGFRGRILFRQYNPQKSNKYGIKIYKLCTDSGYTWSYRIYSGEERQIPGLDKPGSVVISLCDELLNEGRLLFTDNWYTSIPLAKYLKQRRTDLCGTLRKNRRELPQQVIQQRVTRGQIAAQQNDCITVLKWFDKREVHMLSTCHNHEMRMSGGYRNILKPKMILTYNEGKKGIDIADQLASYNSPVRKTLVWYKKIAADLLAISVVNAILVYNELHPGEKMKMLDSHQHIIKKLLGLENEANVSSNPSSSSSLRQVCHKMTRIPRKADGKICQKRCASCYKKLKETGSTTNDARKMAKQVVTECRPCKKAFCLTCFNENH